MSLFTCCVSRRRPVYSERTRLSIPLDDIERVTRLHNVSDPTEPAPQPPSYFPTRSNTPSVASRRLQLPLLAALTPHTTGGTFRSSTVPTHFTGHSIAPSDTDSNYTRSLYRNHDWDAKSRPRSVMSEEAEERQPPSKETELEEERRGRERHRRGSNPASMRSEADPIIWDELEMPPPVYTPRERMQ